MSPSISTSNMWSPLLAVLLTGLLVVGEIYDHSVLMQSCLRTFLTHRQTFLVQSSRKANADRFCARVVNPDQDGQGELSSDTEFPILQHHLEHNKLLRSEIEGLISFMDPPCKEFHNNVMLAFETSEQLTDSFYPYCELMTFDDPSELLKQIQLVTKDDNWVEKQDNLLFKSFVRLEQCVDDITSAGARLPEAQIFFVYDTKSLFVTKIEDESNNHYLFAYLNQGPRALTETKEFQKLWRTDIFMGLAEKNKPSASIRRDYEESCKSYLAELKPVFEGSNCMGENGAAGLLNAINMSEHLSKAYGGERVRNVGYFIEHWRAYFGCSLYLLHLEYKPLGQRLKEKFVSCVRPNSAKKSPNKGN